jgi:hypothetical protein
VKIKRSISEQVLIEDDTLNKPFCFSQHLFSLINEMKSVFVSSNKILSSRILQDNYHKKILLTILHEKVEIDSFLGNDSISLNIIEGKLRFHTRKDSVIINKGQILKLNENVHYRFKNLEETIFVLTINNSP